MDMPSWIVLVPPLLVILLATFSRRIVPSLLFGIITASFIVTNGEPLAAFLLIIKRMLSVSELNLLFSWHDLLGGSYLFICLFLLLLGILIELIISSGGATAYADMIKKRVRSTRSVEQSILFMTHLFFIDDYFNSLTVGSVMRPLTDQFRIPRIKLGLIINTIAAPLAVIVPISSWVADIVMQMRQAGIALPTVSITAPSTAGAPLISAEPFHIFLSVIPYIFYSFIQIGSLWFFITKRISFGIFKEHEQIAEKTGNLFGGKNPVIERKSMTNRPSGSGNLIDFLMPLGLLLTFVASGCFFWGTGKMALVLALSAALSTALSMIYFFFSGRLTGAKLAALSYEGILATAPSVMVLILIWTMSSFLRYDLKTGNYLASLLIGKMSIEFLPPLFFIVGAVISTLMGSAWGAIGILVSIALPMFASYYQHLLPLTIEQAPLVIPLIGAVISGSLVANHCSPLADILLMSATSSGSYHLDLIKAQITFCFSGIMVTIGAFFMSSILLPYAGLVGTSLVTIIFSLIINCTLLYLQGKAFSKKAS